MPKARTSVPTSRKTPRRAGKASAHRGAPVGSGLTFRAFQRLIRDRYLKTDAARGSGGTFLLFMEEVGELATALHDNRPAQSKANPMGKKQPIRKDERDNLVEEFADVLAWLSTLANMHNVDLEDALRKYTEDGRVEGIKY